MDIFGPIQKTTQGSQFVVEMVDRYSKLTEAILTTKINAAAAARTFVKLWVASYGIPSGLLAEIGPQFASELFVAVYSACGANNLTTTEHIAQTNGQTELLDSTPLSRLCHYVCQHQTGCDTNLLPLTYAYNEKCSGP